MSKLSTNTNLITIIRTGNNTRPSTIECKTPSLLGKQEMRFAKIHHPTVIQQIIACKAWYGVAATPTGDIMEEKAYQIQNMSTLVVCVILQVKLV